MELREVELIVGFPDGTWEELWLRVEENELRTMDDGELKEAAVAMAMDLMERSGRDTSFINVVYIAPPEDDLDGVI